MIQVFHAAPPAIQVHALAALVALCLGPVVLWRPRRDALHMALGRLWVGVMALAAGSSLFIHAELGLGGWGPIHLLSVWLLYGLWEGLREIRQGRIAAHREVMRGLYLHGVTLASLLTLLPGRRINQALFGEAELLGLPVIALGLAALLLDVLRRRGRPARA